MEKIDKFKIEKIFDSFRNLNIIIVGDCILDSYMWGTVERISPEAPIPVVTVKKKENRLGGAANVALNVRAMGANPILCSVTGDDENKSLFCEQAISNGLSCEGIITDEKRNTTVKTRVFGYNQQLLRVDEEVLDRIPHKIEKRLLDYINTATSNKKIDAIIIADYDKGVVTPSMIRNLIAISKSKNIPVAADPKKKNFRYYNNLTLFKPNLKELAEGMKTDLVKEDSESIIAAAKVLQEEKNIRYMLVTLSENGVLLGCREVNKIISAMTHQVSDVSGAGDTVIGVASVCMAANMKAADMAYIANLAGSLVCQYVGVTPVKKTRLINEIAGKLKYIPEFNSSPYKNATS